MYSGHEGGYLPLPSPDLSYLVLNKNYLEESLPFGEGRPTGPRLFLRAGSAHFGPVSSCDQTGGFSPEAALASALLLLTAYSLRPTISAQRKVHKPAPVGTTLPTPRLTKNRKVD